MYAIRSDNNSVVYSATNVDGFYTMSSGLEPGQYHIFADLYGWNGEFYPSSIILDLSPSIENVDFNPLELEKYTRFLKQIICENACPRK